MASELIVDFPLKRNHDMHCALAGIIQLYTVDRHYEQWYTEAEYDSMKSDIKRDILRAQASDPVSEEDGSSWIRDSLLLARTSLYTRGAVLQTPMPTCSPRRASEPGLQLAR